MAVGPQPEAVGKLDQLVADLLGWQLWQGLFGFVIPLAIETESITQPARAFPETYTLSPLAWPIM